MLANHRDSAQRRQVLRRHALAAQITNSASGPDRLDIGDIADTLEIHRRRILLTRKYERNPPSPPDRNRLK